METPSHSHKNANSMSKIKEDIEISSLDKEDPPNINLLTGIPSPSAKSKKKSNNASQAIKCFCRIRPIKGENEIFKVKENTEGTVLLVNHDQNLLKKLNNNPAPTFTFSKTFDETSTQIEVFDSTCKNLVEDLVFRKKSGLIFTYGMTCAGKTFTVIGSQSDPGILPLSLKYLYKQFETEEIRGDMSVYCNFVEIYNEEIYDLLSSSNSNTNDAKNKFFKKKLVVKENNKKQFFLPDVVYLKISSLEDFNTALNKGIAKKVHAATNLNQNSSRSHTIFKIILKSADSECEEISLSIVDLAGSERANRTEAQGKELQEACSINQSLSILGKCMEALRYNSIYTQKKLVPFRESKLTKLFQEYFQGDQNVIMITNINPRREDFEETIRALNYSCIAKEIKPIKSKIVVNPNPMKKQVKLVGGSNINNINNIPSNNFSENGFMLNGSMNLMQNNLNNANNDPSHSGSNFLNLETNKEFNLLKLEMERMKEEMFYLKSRSNNISSSTGNNNSQSRNVETESNSNENHNHNPINQDSNIEMNIGNNSLRKFRPYNSYNSYSTYPPRDNFASRAFMFQQEMQMAMMTQMMHMMKKITENQCNPYSMFLPNSFNPGNIQNFQSKFLHSIPLEEDESVNNLNSSNVSNVNDVQFIPPNSGPLNLVFINSKFNDFHMAQKKKRPVRNKKKKEEESANNGTNSDIEFILDKNKDDESSINETLEDNLDKSREEAGEDLSTSISHLKLPIDADNQEESNLEDGEENLSLSSSLNISQPEKKKQKKKKKKKKANNQHEEPEQEENKKKKRKKKPKPKVEDILPEILEISEQSQRINQENQENQEKAFSFGGSPIEKIVHTSERPQFSLEKVSTHSKEELQRDDIDINFMLVDKNDDENYDKLVD